MNYKQQSSFPGFPRTSGRAQAGKAGQLLIDAGLGGATAEGGGRGRQGAGREEKGGGLGGAGCGGIGGSLGGAPVDTDREKRSTEKSKEELRSERAERVEGGGCFGARREAMSREVDERARPAGRRWMQMF